ncbi:hypothetical protein [Calothrix sp. PCC 7507]|uniref:hypothetical protein n=1 Tax=Calothrix sp. PCC 7507 TaxID=99598 RepID=UPI0005A8B1A3|nr:hypothetical protein [Calothrix sp. PCC 7507]
MLLFSHVKGSGTNHILYMEWQAIQAVNLHLDYGLPLFKVKEQGDSLQDNGLYFSLQYQPF